MTVWILVLVVSVGSAGGPAMQEFSDKEACESALKEVARAFRMQRLGDADSRLQISGTGICVRKSSPAK
jgi:hypothetical protein